MADWLQFGIVLIVISAAAAYLARRAALLVRSRNDADCGGGCSGCPKSVAREPHGKAASSLVQIEGLNSPGQLRA